MTTFSMRIGKYKVVCEMTDGKFFAAAYAGERTLFDLSGLAGQAPTRRIEVLPSDAIVRPEPPAATPQGQASVAPPSGGTRSDLVEI